jgi:hypothetical protein
MSRSWGLWKKVYYRDDLSDEERAGCMLFGDMMEYDVEVKDVVV